VFKLFIHAVNFLIRMVLGLVRIDLWRKVSQSKSAFLQAKIQAQKHEFMAAFNIGEEILDLWYASESLVERQFRQLVINGLLQQVRQKLADWEPLTEQEYDAALKRSHWLATEGRLSEAIALLEPVNHKFYQPQGKKLLTKLQELVAGQNSFHLGWLAEQSGNFLVAIEHYENAAIFSPDWQTESRLRLGMIALKTQTWAAAVELVANINNSTAVYIQEYAIAQQNNLPVAKQSNLHITSEELLREIQRLVDNDNLLEARAASRKFIQQFGHNSLVEDNLNQYIQPRLEIALWQNQDYLQLTQITEQSWSEQLNITTLHNWALATYHQAVVAPNQLDDLIVSWSMALANLHLDPSLLNISWLKTPVDLNEVRVQLQQRLEELIHMEETNSTEYARIHELYRREVVALELRGTPPTSGLRIKGLFFTPSCYERYQHILPTVKFPGKLWATLYTPWWRSVLACYDGKIFQAMQVKPDNISSEAEEFAQKFVSYHEGCYYLQIVPGGYPRWRSAIAPLTLAQSEIRNSVEWCAELDQLCEIQYQKIWNESERAEFAQFWYNLIDSQTARNYLKQT